MAKPSLKDLCLAALALCVAIQTWLLLQASAPTPSGEERLKRSTAPTEPAEAASGPTPTTPPAAPIEPERSTEAFHSENDLRKETLTEIVTLADAGHLSVTLDLLDHQGRLTEGFQELFRLSSSEVQSLQRVIDASRAEVRRLTAANATLLTLPEGHLHVEVQPFISEGAALYDQVVGALRDTLGERQFDAFLRLERGDFEYDFEHFGANLRSVTIELPDPSSSFPVYLTQDKRRRSELEYSTGGGSYPTWSGVRKHFPELTDILPEAPPQP